MNHSGLIKFLSPRQATLINLKTLNLLLTTLTSRRERTLRMNSETLPQPKWSATIITCTWGIKDSHQRQVIVSVEILRVTPPSRTSSKLRPRTWWFPSTPNSRRTSSLTQTKSASTWGSLVKLQISLMWVQLKGPTIDHLLCLHLKHSLKKIYKIAILSLGGHLKNLRRTSTS